MKKDVLCHLAARSAGCLSISASASESGVTRVREEIAEGLMIATAEAILPWARRQRDEALNLIGRIERGEDGVGSVGPGGAMTNESLKTVVILRRVVADLEELLSENDEASNSSVGPA